MFHNDYQKNDNGSGMAKALGKAIVELTKFEKSKPDLILSGFDIAANFAVTIAGAHMNIPVAHTRRRSIRKY